MPAPRNVHRGSTIVMSSILVLLGLAMVARTLLGGGGALAIGLLLGLLFIAAGAGRIYLAARPSRSRGTSS